MEGTQLKVGIMGGTFDPIHTGHLILGEAAYEQFQLDKILFMPSGNPPHKRNREGRATDDQRVEMVRRAIHGNPHFSLSLDDMAEEGYSYSYLLLERLKKANPNVSYYFIVGADSLFDFEEWKRPDRISKACTIIAAIRDHVSSNRFNDRLSYLSQKYEGDFLKMDSPNIDIASKELRSRVKEGRSIRYYVPDSVADYIYENKIYRKEHIV